MSRRTTGLVLVLACVSATLAISYVQKQPCARSVLPNGYFSTHLCYTDTAWLWRTEDLDGGRLPYLDRCTPPPGATCDEYPVLLMYVLRLTSLPASNVPGFFLMNVLLLALAAIVAAVALFRMVGRRALYFAIAPTLLVSGFINWDLIPVALSALATLAFLRRRDVASGVLLGLGAATKIYPAIFLIPFVADRFREGRRRDAFRLTAAAGLTWVAVNLPFILLAFRRWGFFYRFTSSRPMGWASLWFVGCYRVTRSITCGKRHVGLENLLSLVALVAIVAAVWAIRVRRLPGTPRWMMAFPLVAALLLTNKVYSPQYSLWLLPLFALAFPDLVLFLAFEIADLAVFVTGFAWKGQLRAFELGYPGGWVSHVGIGVFQIALVARAVVLVACLVAFARGRGAERTVQEPAGAPEPSVRGPAFAPIALICQACSAFASVAALVLGAQDGARADRRAHLRRLPPRRSRGDPGARLPRHLAAHAGPQPVGR